VFAQSTGSSGIRGSHGIWRTFTAWLPNGENALNFPDLVLALDHVSQTQVTKFIYFIVNLRRLALGIP
jgi:hypothetical protein